MILRGTSLSGGCRRCRFTRNFPEFSTIFLEERKLLGNIARLKTGKTTTICFFFRFFYMRLSASWCQIEDPSNTPRSSRHHGIEGFERRVPIIRPPPQSLASKTYTRTADICFSSRSTLLLSYQNPMHKWRNCAQSGVTAVNYMHS